MSLMSLGVTRGLIGQLLGTVAGMALIIVVRLLFGYEQVWYDEGAWTLGAIGGIIGFMIGVGALDDWYAWILGKETPLRHGPPVGQPAWTRYFGVDYNHKVIGVQYGVTGLLMIVIGGSFALIFRTELTRTGLQFLEPGTYNTMISMHGWVALMGILVGIGGMANYLVPLMLGAADMAFPRLNAFGFWINIPSIVLLLASLYYGWDGGWTVYPPLSTIGSVGYQLVFYGIFALGLSSILGSVNLITTIARMRPQGMSLFRMPIFCWSVLATSLLQLTGTQMIALSFLMLSVERSMGMGFFDPAKGGQPILFQHLFWFYSHPAVYVFILPGLGIISEILPVFTRKPLFGYRWVGLSSLAIAFIGFLAWGHHMFVSGYSPYLRVAFMISTLLVSVPTGVKFFSWAGTLWGGKMTYPTPMLFILGGISVFLIGGLSGPILGTAASDIFLHDTYFVIGHFHATIFGGFMFPFFAAIYFWYPKITGRMYNELLGKIHFWIMTPAFWLQSIGQMSVGVMGMRRRIADYDPALGVEPGHIMITIAAFAIAFSILVMIYNLLHSSEVGALSGSNPWRARSPEWQIPSPAPEHSFARPLRVIGEPYDYGLQDGGYVVMTQAAGDD
jgi:cytochrome c oxidase subunit 1